MKDDRKKKAMLLGLGLDKDEGHRRVTKGDNFLLVGGSRDTHEEMQDKAMSFNGELQKRGKRIEEVSREEFREIADRVGMDVPPERKEED